MQWACGVLTWNAPEQCAETLRALAPHLDMPVHVLDNGSDPPFATPFPVTVHRAPVNHGAGKGLAALMTALLATDAEAFVVIEDDWILQRSLDVSVLEPWVDDPAIIQVRLGVRSLHLTESYVTHALEGRERDLALQQQRQPLEEDSAGYHQRLRIFWSSNPFACHRRMAPHLLVGLDEVRLGRHLWPLRLDTMSTTPGHFRHVGLVRSRRDQVGWRK